MSCCCVDLNTVWFAVIGVLFTGYALLDGFDLGVGIVHLFAKSDDDRRIAINAIGPVWDGNEVWLLAGGGALFAAFPRVYGTVFSGFYLAIMLLLFALIFRAVSIEFRGKLDWSLWRKAWDFCFSAASLAAALLLGVALGNIARGIPLDAEGEFAGTFLGLLNPYALVVGLSTAALFAMHGALYLNLKAEGDLQASARRSALGAFVVFAALYVLLTFATWLGLPHMIRPFDERPLLFAIPLILVLAMADIPFELRAGRDLRAFLASCATIVCLMLLFGVGMFPNMVLSSPDPAHSLTIYNAASSAKTLRIMLTMVLIGMPLVLVYTAYIYRVFRGKVKLDSMSY
ncbi:MAG: cytochrome d ubiquinol oxidase subunit II [Elusimicrobiota bacterium]